MDTRKSRINAIASFVPEKIVENSFFEARFGFAEGDILKKTGLKSRRHADKGVIPTDMGVIAAEKVIADSGVPRKSIDMIISAGTSRDQSIPPDSMRYAHKLELPGIQCLHTEAVCLSFLNAMEIADLYVGSGKKETILVISSEQSSRVMDLDDPSSSFLLADGAAAAIIGPTDGAGEIIASYFLTEALGKNIDVASIEAGGIKNIAADAHYNKKMATFHVDGPRELKLAVRYIPKFLKELLSRAGCTLKDIDHVIPHQVVPRMISKILSYLGLSPEKLLLNTEYGNMAAASIPVVFADAVADGTIKRGDRVLLFGGAAGFSLGGVILTY